MCVVYVWSVLNSWRRLRGWMTFSIKLCVMRSGDVMMLLQSETFFLIMSSGERWEVTRGEWGPDCWHQLSPCSCSSPAATNGSQADTGHRCTGPLSSPGIMSSCVIDTFHRHEKMYQGYLNLKRTWLAFVGEGLDRCVLKKLFIFFTQPPYPDTLIRK